MKKIISLATVLLLTACGDAKQESEINQQVKTETHLEKKLSETSVENKPVEIPNSDSKSLKTLKESITNASANVACDDVSQCYVISTGSNPCGGASGYAVLSAKTSDKALLTKTSQDIIRLEKSKHALEGTMGICQHLVEPKAMCQGNQCVAVESQSDVY